MHIPPPDSNTMGHGYFHDCISPLSSKLHLISETAEVGENSGVSCLPVCVSVMDSDRGSRASCTALGYESSSHPAAKGVPAPPILAALIGSCPHDSSTDENR